jgi:hypothetical protein
MSAAMGRDSMSSSAMASAPMAGGAMASNHRVAMKKGRKHHHGMASHAMPTGRS